MSSVKEVKRGIRAPTGLQSLAARIREEIKQGVQKPFRQVIDVSSGDPHRAGMAPMSFVRQVMAVCFYPKLLKDESLPPDVRQRAQQLLGVCNGGSVGSYSVTSYGIPHVHKSVAEFIMRRDGGVSSNPGDIIISNGSQTCLTIILHLMASGEGKTQTGVLIPIPCPHTLPALLDDNGVTLVPYQLMEDRGWAVDLDALQLALKTAREHCDPRAIYISNPGNPTGHVQDRKTIDEVIRFAATEGLVLLADEVYQDSVYGHEKDFISYKRVLFDMGKQYSAAVDLMSFHSLSSAMMGDDKSAELHLGVDKHPLGGAFLLYVHKYVGVGCEEHKLDPMCGLRGGYIEVINMDPAVKKHLKDMQKLSTPAVLPQLSLEVMVNPPAPGDPSYETYSQEILHSQTTLSQNAQRACEFLNDLPGMNCQPAMGGVFLYPCLHLPLQMIDEAKMSGVEPDVLYCQRLLEEEGVCLGAGCENGQEDRNYHVRLCVLAPPATLEEILARLCSFHLRLLDTFP